MIYIILFLTLALLIGIEIGLKIKELENITKRNRGIEYWKSINKIIFIPRNIFSIREWILLYKLSRDSDIVGFRKS